MGFSGIKIECHFILVFCAIIQQCQPERELLIYTAATKETDGYLRYVRSLHMYDLKLQKTLGLGKKFMGYAFKIRMLRKDIEKYKDRHDVIILFTDSYDVIFTGGKAEILKAFDTIGSKIVFSAETNCWPERSLNSMYPHVQGGYRFLNSGGFLGYAPQIYQLLPQNISDSYDDQLYYTLTYLDQDLRMSLGIALDNQALIFQSLHQAKAHVSLIYLADDTKLFNMYTNTTPIIIHGNGDGKLELHVMSNYLAKSWTTLKGCIPCHDNRINLADKSENDYPNLLMSLFIDRPSSFLEIKLRKIFDMSYPKKKIFLFVYNKIFSHDSMVSEWIAGHGMVYAGVKYMKASDRINVHFARISALNTCILQSCDAVFSLDSEVNVDNRNILEILISYNRSILAPVMIEPNTLQSTFWGLTNDQFEYVPSFDYEYIISNERRGIWRVSGLSHIFLIWRSMLEIPAIHSYPRGSPRHPDVVLSELIRVTDKYSMFLYATNLDYYGSLSNMDHVNLDNFYYDLWEVRTNTKLWEEKYLHPKYYETLRENSVYRTVCSEVFLVPIFKQRFFDDIANTIKNSSIWSTAHLEALKLYADSEKDGAVNIYMSQFGYEDEWLHIVEKYIKPVAEKVFKWYHNQGDVTKSVIRYTYDKPYIINLHDDSNSRIQNIAINIHNKKNKVEGSNILRRNCSAEDVRNGWGFINSGRLTHLQQVLRSLNVTKHIVVSFVNSA